MTEGPKKYESEFQCQMRAIQEVWMTPQVVYADDAVEAAEKMADRTLQHENWARVRVTDSSGRVSVFELKKKFEVYRKLDDTP